MRTDAKKKKIAKKTIILYVLKILYLGSTAEKPITILQITHVLNSMEISCDRKTISRNIDYLKEFGLPVVKCRGGGCYYDHSDPKKDLY